MSSDAKRQVYSSPRARRNYVRARQMGRASKGEYSRTADAWLARREFRRRVWHTAPGFLPFLLWPIPHRDPISPMLYSIILLLGVGLATGILLEFRQIQRSGERDQRFWAVAGYAGSVLAVFLLFPGMPELGMALVAVLAFGDGSATLGGLWFRGRALAWNRDKTIAGSACFLLVGIPMSAIIYWGEANNLEAIEHNGAVSFGTALIVGASATVIAALAESLPSRINDNVRVGVAAALTLATVQWLVVGWT